MLLIGASEPPELTRIELEDIVNGAGNSAGCRMSPTMHDFAQLRRDMVENHTTLRGIRSEIVLADISQMTKDRRER